MAGAFQASLYSHTRTWSESKRDQQTFARTLRVYWISCRSRSAAVCPVPEEISRHDQCLFGGLQKAQLQSMSYAARPMNWDDICHIEMAQEDRSTSFASRAEGVEPITEISAFEWREHSWRTLDLDHLKNSQPEQQRGRAWGVRQSIFSARLFTGSHP